MGQYSYQRGPFPSIGVVARQVQDKAETLLLLFAGPLRHPSRVPK